MYRVSQILRTYNRKRKSPYSCDVFDDIVMFKSNPARDERRNVVLFFGFCMEYLESQSKTISRHPRCVFQIGLRFRARQSKPEEGGCFLIGYGLGYLHNALKDCAPDNQSVAARPAFFLG